MGGMAGVGTEGTDGPCHAGELSPPEGNAKVLNHRKRPWKQGVDPNMLKTKNTRPWFPK